MRYQREYSAELVAFYHLKHAAENRPAPAVHDVPAYSGV
jgi:hypothetical protein